MFLRWYRHYALLRSVQNEPRRKVGVVMEIKINKEIKDYNETMFFGLSVRQFVFSILACASAVLVYFLCEPYMGTEITSWLCMLGAVPFAIFGFARYNGMYAEQIIKAWIRSDVLMPRYLLFKGAKPSENEMEDENEQEI